MVLATVKVRHLFEKPIKHRVTVTLPLFGHNR
jgi:hypothetical protein